MAAAHKRYINWVLVIGHLFYYHMGLDYHRIFNEQQHLPERLERFCIMVEQFKIGRCVTEMRLMTSADAEAGVQSTILSYAVR